MLDEKLHSNNLEFETFSKWYVHTLNILFPSNHNIHKISCGHWFWASDPLINRTYKNLSIKGSEAQKQIPYKLL